MVVWGHIPTSRQTHVSKSPAQKKPSRRELAVPGNARRPLHEASVVDPVFLTSPNHWDRLQEPSQVEMRIYMHTHMIQYMYTHN